MFYNDPRLQYPVRVDKPNPIFAKMLQQAVGGVEGEIRVCLQYLMQAWSSRGPKKYRDMLLHTGTEEISHIEMLSVAISMNLEGAPLSVQEEAAKDPFVHAALGGEMARHVLSAGLGVMAVDSNGVPFDGNSVIVSGNITADMFANVAAETTGRLLATRLYEWTDDPGMKDMLSFLIARDTMHQNQWLAVIEELGGDGQLPVPNSFPQELEQQQFSYAYMGTGMDPNAAPEGRWTQGPSVDGKGEFSVIRQMEPQGEEPQLSAAPPKVHAQLEEVPTP